MENYSIIDLEGFAKSLRAGVASSFEENYTESLDGFISVNQVINLVKKNNLGKDEENNYIINEKVFDDIFNEIREWFYSVGLSKLASAGYVDCAWDNDSNEMVFWLANEAKEKISSKPSQDNNESKRKNNKS
jgi:type II secretory pathway component HofQ